MEPTIGEITMFAGNFPPRGWTFCNGQLLPITQNEALFSILGTIYGGDGRTTFGLPDLRGRVPIHQGNGPGLPDVRMGQKGGSHQNTLNTSQIPSHNHVTGVQVSTAPADNSNPSGFLASANTYATEKTNGTLLNGVEIGNTGGSQPINNMPPYLGVNFIIALVGIYPSRH